MTEQVKVTFVGTFPREDIPLIAEFYGCDVDDTEADKLAFIETRAKKLLANDLAKATSHANLAATRATNATVKQNVLDAIVVTDEFITV
jgi:hypothetical protein